MKTYLIIIFTLLLSTMQVFAEENIDNTEITEEKTEETIEEVKISIQEKLDKASKKKIKIYKFNPVKNKDGYITLIEFNDLSCDECLKKSEEVFNTIKNDNLKSIKVIYKHLSSDSKKLTNQKEIYSMLANDYGKFWAFKEKVTLNSYTKEDQYVELLLSLGLTKKEINNSLTNKYQQYYYNLDADNNFAKSVRSSYTPMFFIDNYRIDEDISLNEVNEYIELKKVKYLEDQKKENNKYKMGRF